MTSSRLLVVAHGATVRTRDLVFGDDSDLVDRHHVVPLDRRVTAWWCGPEPACRQTASALGGTPTADPELAGPRFGDWAGRSLVEVPEAVGWLRDPSARPPGGESLVELIERVGRWCDQPREPGLGVAVVTSLSARALAIHALGAPPEVIFRLDIGPLQRVTITGGPGGWRLRP